MLNTLYVIFGASIFFSAVFIVVLFVRCNQLTKEFKRVWESRKVLRRLIEERFYKVHSEIDKLKEK